MGQTPSQDGGCSVHADAVKLDTHLGYKPGRWVSWCDSELFPGPGLAGLP
jgi:hypothetical protein